MKNLTEYLNEGLLDNLRWKKMQKTLGYGMGEYKAPKNIVAGFNKIMKSSQFDINEFKEYLVFVEDWIVEQTLAKYPQYKDSKVFQDEYMFKPEDEKMSIQFNVGDYYVIMTQGDIAPGQGKYDSVIEIGRKGASGAMQWWFGYGGYSGNDLISFGGVADPESYEEDITNEPWFKQLKEKYRPFGDLAFGRNTWDDKKSAYVRLKEVFKVLEKIA